MADQPTRKFMFERSFDDGSVIAPVRQSRPVPYTQEQIDAIKKESYESGFAAGQKAAGEEKTQHLNLVMAKLDAHIGALLASAAAARPEQELRIREAALAIARKILPDYTKRHGLEEIEALVAGIIGQMTSEPRLAVRINETQFESVDAGLKELSEKQGYAGKIVLVADATVAPDDCRIEWADGGIERNSAALWKHIASIVAPGIEMPEMTAAPAPETSQETSEKETHHG
jgi:flagellar assembly protein FliH